MALENPALSASGENRLRRDYLWRLFRSLIRTVVAGCHTLTYVGGPLADPLYRYGRIRNVFATATVGAALARLIGNPVSEFAVHRLQTAFFASNALKMKSAVPAAVTSASLPRMHSA